MYRDYVVIHPSFYGNVKVGPELNQRGIEIPAQVFFCPVTLTLPRPEKHTEKLPNTHKVASL